MFHHKSFINTPAHSAKKELANIQKQLERMNTLREAARVMEQLVAREQTNPASSSTSTSSSARQEDPTASSSSLDVRHEKGFCVKFSFATVHSHPICSSCIALTSSPHDYEVEANSLASDDSVTSRYVFCPWFRYCFPHLRIFMHRGSCGNQWRCFK